MSSQPTNYRQFWPYYLREHSRILTRRIHYAGTGVAVVGIIATIATGNLWFLLAAAIGGYAPAWAAHFFVEKNRPATFRYPFWSLISDFRMFFMWLADRLQPELKRAGCLAEIDIEEPPRKPEQKKPA